MTLSMFVVVSLCGFFCAAWAASSSATWCYCWLQTNANPRISFEYSVSSCEQCVAQGTATQSGCSNLTQAYADVHASSSSSALLDSTTTGAICSTVAESGAAAWTGTYDVNTGSTPFVSELAAIDACDSKTCCCPKGEFVISAVGNDTVNGAVVSVLNGTVQLEGAACGNATEWAGSVTLLVDYHTFLIVKSSWPFSVNTLVRAGDQVLVWGHNAQCSFLLSPPSHKGTVAAVVIVVIILVLAAAGGFWWWRRRRQTGFNKV